MALKLANCGFAFLESIKAEIYLDSHENTSVINCWPSGLQLNRDSNTGVFMWIYVNLRNNSGGCFWNNSFVELNLSSDHLMLFIKGRDISWNQELNEKYDSRKQIKASAKCHFSKVYDMQLLWKLSEHFQENIFDGVILI